MQSLSEYAKAKAFEMLEKRRNWSMATPQINNGNLRAGQVMFFYCKCCGWVCDIMPEEYMMSTARPYCSECQGMIDRGLLKVDTVWERPPNPKDGLMRVISTSDLFPY